MPDFFCLPHAAFKLSLSAYAGIKLVKLTLGSSVNDSEMQSMLCSLPPELLAEIVGVLSCSTYTCALRVSRSWFETLNSEIRWERLCRLHWPGVTHNSYTSWQKFATQGGGDMLGARLLHHLKYTSAEAMKCSTNHYAQCWLIEAQGVHCDACGDTNHLHGMRMRTCRECSYNRCDKCYTALHPPAAIVNGAVNHGSSDGWSALHYACRLGFRDVVNSILDARANIECPDDLHGYTPLMVAATHGQEEICSLLLTRGAAKETMNLYAKTAVDCATSWGHIELVKKLR